jgi:hypothetical protein
MPKLVTQKIQKSHFCPKQLRAKAGQKYHTTEEWSYQSVAKIASQAPSHY